MKNILIINSIIKQNKEKILSVLGVLISVLFGVFILGGVFFAVLSQFI